MKKFTCSEMGGVCEAEISGETVEEVMQKGKEHVHGSEDDAHKKVVSDMESMGEEAKQQWAEGLKKKWEEKPDA